MKFRECNSKLKKFAAVVDKILSVSHIAAQRARRITPKENGSDD